MPDDVRWIRSYVLNEDGGRVGTFRGLRSGKKAYGTLVFGEKADASTTGAEGDATDVGDRGRCHVRMLRRGSPPSGGTKGITPVTHMRRCVVVMHQNAADDHPDGRSRT